MSKRKDEIMEGHKRDFFIEWNSVLEWTMIHDDVIPIRGNYRNRIKWQ
jgi:hypothetical protein